MICCINGGIDAIALVKLYDGFESVELIDERGWSLQEGLLFSRIIEFGFQQTRWINLDNRSLGPPSKILQMAGRGM